MLEFSKSNTTPSKEATYIMAFFFNFIFIIHFWLQLIFYYFKMKEKNFHSFLEPGLGTDAVF